MPNDSAVANSLAAVDKRFESMSALAAMLAGAIDRQRRELQELKLALGRQEGGPVSPGDIGPEMLEG
jgi:hypothetical protein